MGDLSLSEEAGKALREQEEYYQKLQVFSDNFSRTTESLNRNLSEALHEITKIQKESANNGEKALAMEQINRLSQQLQTEYSGHIDVRNTMLGVIRDMNPDLVRKKTVCALAEELWIKCPEYWLAHALIAVAAWINNEKETCRNAVKASIMADSNKSSLLYCLLLLRLDRMDAARSWFEYYLKQQNPLSMSPESSILLQAYLGGLFGRDDLLQQKVENVVKNWQYNMDEDYRTVQQIKDTYYGFIQSRYTSHEPLKTLLTYSPFYNRIENLRKEFGKMEQMLEFVANLREQNNQETPASSHIISDQVLDRLLNEKVAEEQDIMRQIHYYKLICEYEGDTTLVDNAIVSAKISYRAGIKNDTEKNDSDYVLRSDESILNDISEDNLMKKIEMPYRVGSRMVSWALDENGEVSPQVRLYAMKHTSQWLQEAARTAMEITQKRVKNGMPRIPLKINGWKGDTDGEDYKDLEKDMQTYFIKRKRQIQFLNFGNMTALVIMALSLALAVITPYAFSITAAATIYLTYRIVHGLRHYETKVQQSLKTLEAAIKEAFIFYEEARGEEVYYKNLIQEIDAL